jgi:tRNA-dihydrouridine synthase B
MITSDSRLWKTGKSEKRLAFHDETEPRWIQIAGADPAMMEEAARFNEARGAQIIDINMGCPAKKVCRRAAGSALLKDEALVASILETVVGAVDVPVTLKMRLGWSRDMINAPDIARIAEACGISLVTVHGRTRECRFAGEVDYTAIARVKEAVTIPVIANGDIDSAPKASRVLSETGCDGVMVGRAAQGRPWIASQIDHYLNTGEIRENPARDEITRLLVTHIGELHRFYGESAGVRIARKHVGWYLDALVEPAFRRYFNQLETAVSQIEAVATLMDEAA